MSFSIVLLSDIFTDNDACMQATAYKIVKNIWILIESLRIVSSGLAPEG